MIPAIALVDKYISSDGFRIERLVKGVRYLISSVHYGSLLREGAIAPADSCAVACILAGAGLHEEEV
jgi:hypothetical protein